MRHLRTSVEISASAASVWDWIAVFERWPEWGTTIRAVESAAHQVETGVTGRVQTLAGVWLPFTITDVDKGRSWHWHVAGLTATGHYVAPLDDAISRAAFTVPWVYAPYLAVLRNALGRLKTLAENS